MKGALRPIDRRFTLEEKTAILREHLMERTPVSELCEEYKTPVARNSGDSIEWVVSVTKNGTEYHGEWQERDLL